MSLGMQDYMVTSFGDNRSRFLLEIQPCFPASGQQLFRSYLYFDG